MSNLATNKPHITFLFSDTGGGHRAASEAIIEALHNEFGDAVVTEMVDFLKDYAPPPFNLLPEIYPDMMRAPELWGAMFDHQRRPATGTYCNLDILALRPAGCPPVVARPSQRYAGQCPSGGHTLLS